MLQINVMSYASDALEDAMRLAQVKALNSFTFSDCLNYLNYSWSDIYNRMAQIDDGYYGTNVQLTEQLTKLPPFVKNTVQIYAAQSPVGFDRIEFRNASNTDLTASNIYKISGNELWCPDAIRRKVWMYFVPQCPQIFFTHHNRDPKIYETYSPVYEDKYNIYRIMCYHNGNIIDKSDWSADVLLSADKWYMIKRNNVEDVTDITENLRVKGEEDAANWDIVYLSCDYPYIFVTYKHAITGEHLSGFFDKDFSWNEYNPFAYTGRNSNIEYMKCHWNDKTGMGVVVKDYNDLDNNTPRIKELGWTPDTLLNYPVPEMYRYLVARLADKLSALNESNIMGVQKELVEAHYAFEAVLEKDKASWKRINNVNPAFLGDWL